MSDHFKHLFDVSIYALPWLAFLAGLAGSLHCVGMCGGLVSACAPDKKGIIFYQIGRLFGYSLLGLFAGTLGHLVSSQFQSNFLKVVPPLTLGSLFIYWGYKSYRNQKEIPAPRIIKSSYDYIWKTFLPNDKSPARPFSIGLLSILLPCGLLYTLVISVTAFHDPIKALIAMFFFWLGTVPAMSIAPAILNKFINKTFFKLPKLIGLSFMILGLFTIIYRLSNIYIQTSNSGALCH